MSALRQWLLVGLAALVALLLVAGVMAGVTTSSVLGPTYIFGYTMMIGVLPALLIGVPAYVFLLRKGQARWYYVLALGVIPGMLLLLMGDELGLLAVVCGGIVALITHLVCRLFGLTASPT
jgi:hypothetical protein